MTAQAQSTPPQMTQTWDRPVRIFHWVNFFVFLGLVMSGLVILYSKSIGIAGVAKLNLKTIHTYFGYVFAINLLVRLAWGFTGSSTSRWCARIPFTAKFNRDMAEYLAARRRGESIHYEGLNPPGILITWALILLMIAQAVSGIVLAGTDLYQGPLGNYFANWVAAPGVNPASLIAGNMDMVDKTAYAAMRAFRTVFIRTHEYAFYAVTTLALIHIVSVVYSEIKERSGLVSAMISGKKKPE